MKSMLESWKYPSLLLFGIGISNVGAWIYFIALNLIVLDMTESALAVSILYLIRPIAAMCTNSWSGSFIDRMNKRSLMIGLHFSRAFLIFLLPLFDSLIYMYVLVFLINMGNSAFYPTSGTYIAKLVPPEMRKRFNAVNSLIGSGAFMIGPAIAGLLFLIGSPTSAIYINAGALAIAGLVMLLMPNLEKDSFMEADIERISWKVLKQDWGVVITFYRKALYVLAICLLFSVVMVVMATAVDSLEAAFARVVLGLSESDYGILVSVAGAGIIVGAAINVIIVKRVANSIMIGVGTLGVGVGYLIYAFSGTFAIAAVGFFVLAFFIAFANAGYTTFYQNHIPVDLMGRVGSINGFIEASLTMFATIVVGVAAEWISIESAVLGGVILMVLLGVVLCACVLLPSKKRYYEMPNAHNVVASHD
ncbi:MFS transporter [Paenibacillus sp. GSMTC-2017]|uniref:MFS transporter n=1 Tax=Paenibacillus sp. GSMTC-2017 TaxID=2794350 RepID=UPI0018D8D173|nr:MFS transporter [Paenibacillus sp. GSMTC-2017]MBH5320433.1 MFS transporter [Paenibacillus sp. GSMTC-2017]